MKRVIRRWKGIKPPHFSENQVSRATVPLKTPNIMKAAHCVVNLILIAWIAGLVADAFYMIVSYQFRETQALVPPVHTSHDFAKQSIVASGPVFHQLSYYKPITARDLFKTHLTGKNQRKHADDTGQLKAAQMDVKLWGTVSGDQTSRFAVVEAKSGTSGRKQLLLREGDKIEDATIKKILRDKLVISLNGQRQVLLLEEYKSQTRRRPTGRATNRSARTHRRSIRRSTIENAVSNVRQVMTQARITPRNDGLVISAIRPGSIFRRLGLRNGDVVAAVNGRTIQSVDDALSLYNRLRNDTSVTIDLRRHGRLRTIEYTIR